MELYYKQPVFCPYCGFSELIEYENGTSGCPKCHMHFLISICGTSNPHIGERWLDIRGFEEIYQVSSHLRIRSVDRLAGGKRRIKGRMLSTYIKNNELYCSLRIKGRSKEYNVRKLWQEAEKVED
ncbi:hypothetical protein H8S37_10660 [Mediterraneibacter sp. NSJ-55]|uniref:NUMOD4 domain-containing protein n=1 Tax=Mediterraneibacter hominis TaxID=2763054 RepID=A0A923LJD3_9FIRM|nr:NUMOD4 domain-containing protein [Mediterraneibacter hominis]MBC5689378.1 hypothetical protein [Mediterraneibacter hominis]